MLDMDFEKKINFIIFKIHSAKKKALAEPEPAKFRLDAHGEPVEIEPASSSCQPARVDPQTILISATLTSGIKEIARRLNVVDPVHIDEAPGAQVNVAGIDREKEDEITLPARLSHFYTIVPSKLRLVSLIAFILDKFVYNKVAPKTKMLVFASTNDSVQFHEAILRTFINRKFSLYLDNDGDDEVADMDVGSDIDEFIANEDDDSFELNLKRGTAKKPKKLAGKKTAKIQKKSAPTLNSGNNLIDVFALYGNMEQHKRADILSKYCQSDSGILICTDVAARGLDMPNIDWIVQFNPPTSRFDYVHRVGRTARVGHRGSGLIYLEPAETAYLDELKKLNINIKEVKLDSIMECLNLEGKFYPRQINSDSLKFPRNQEECANSMQFYVEEYVEQSPETHELARKAYMSFIRSYSTYSSELKSIFYVKNLHLGHVAKSFGLREAPSEITLDRKPRERPTFNRDRPRPNDRSGLNGLLRNYKSVSEFDSGFDRVASKKGVGKKRSLADRIKKLSPASTPASSGRPQQAKNVKKIIKKNMDIFD